MSDVKRPVADDRLGRPRRERAGFTLIELLAVIAIIAMLLAIMSPSLKGVLKYTRTVACKTNLHSMSTGFTQAGTDNDGQFFTYNWYPLATHENYWTEVLRPYWGSHDVLVCPEATAPWPADSWGATTTSWWTLASGSSPSGTIRGTYAHNEWLMNHYWGRDWAGAYENIHQVTPNTPVFVDSTWVDTIPRHTNTWPRDLDSPNRDIAWYSEDHYSWIGMWRCSMDRHSMAVNVAFIAGEVRTVPLPDLWQLNWSKTFQPTDTPPGYNP